MFYFLLAYRNVFRHKRRSAITIGAVTFGIAALILANGFIDWMLLEFRETTIKSQLGHLQIVRPGYHNAGKADPYAYLLPSQLSELEAVDKELLQIKTIFPRISFSGLISYGESTLSFIGDGIYPQEQEVFGDALKISSGKNLSTDDSTGIIVGEGLARNLGVNVGDQVVLLATTVSGSINAIEVNIRGLFSTVTKSYDDSALRLPIETAYQLLRAQGPHTLVILLNDTSETDAVLVKLQNILPQHMYEIIPWYKLADFYNKTIVIFTKQILGIKIIIALIILLSITNTMTMSVIERTGEIGTAMALGTKRTGIIQHYLSEGILIGCIGGLSGVMIGLLLANIISSIGIPMPPPPGMSRGYIGEIMVTWNAVIEAIVLATGTTLVASIYPAWKASRMQIVDALRHNR